MKIILPIFFLFFAYFSTSAQSKDEKAIVKAMHTQAEKWNTRDLDGFMSFYWHSDSLRFVSKNGITRSWSKVKANYEKTYGKTGDDLGKLAFEVLELTKIDKKSYFMVGKWKVDFEKKEQRFGYFTLIWRKINRKWTIIIDHTS